jgi:glutathione peroxidase
MPACQQRDTDFHVPIILRVLYSPNHLEDTITMLLRISLAVTLLFASMAASAECSTLLDRSYRPLAGKTPVNLCSEFQGKVLLIVNTASKCGFTPQYDGLEKLHAELSGRGFAVLGFPSNDFAGQEPGTEAEIRDFCTLTYGVKFPMFEKTAVKGDNADPLYKELAAEGGGEPGWNFHKYLIGKDGKVLQSFGSKVKPDAPELRAAIEAALK